MTHWLDRVKFGNGHDGSPAVSGTINSYAACTGTATQTSLTTALAANAGDVILIHQSQGTGAGQWEINYVLADAGATLTLAYPLAYSYGTGAQAVLVPQYTGGTLSGAVTATAWGGSYGGIIALMSNGALTISGSLSVNGVGHRGGAPGVNTYPNYAYQGESYIGVGVQSINANGTAGGGGKRDRGLDGAGGGGGGGNGTVGIKGVDVQGTGGLGGGTAGLANLTIMVFGGGGGGNGIGARGTKVFLTGGKGGGIILIIAKTLSISGSVISQGANGGNAGLDQAGSGAGGGGSILIKCQSATLGTNIVTANGGIGGTGSGLSGSGGNGGVGRIHIDYYSSYTGTTTPTIDASQDTNLKPTVYTGMI